MTGGEHALFRCKGAGPDGLRARQGAAHEQFLPMLLTFVARVSAETTSAPSAPLW
ncbi:MAG: hypothetical protein KF878_27350 [Planctomycetes bacterium]|nr:hypothetical protein [Planctomycetota bacterium]